MPAVHSCRENPRQRENENLDGNTRLGSSCIASSARVSPCQLSLFQQSVTVSRLAVASCHVPKSRAHSKSVESCTRKVSSRAIFAQEYCRLQLLLKNLAERTWQECTASIKYFARTLQNLRTAIHFVPSHRRIFFFSFKISA